ncbi:hypothetical protein L9F63_022329 [Diploptera punctata]|uniref:Maelstrom domain-containing protein n=1 Tax=Diploptera punctata TaxID=6984 RepID=A0AAD7ZMV2_DIPPU|nr:hypothetical protein L9F63_022329 [Diploptera punctata]
MEEIEKKGNKNKGRPILKNRFYSPPGKSLHLKNITEYSKVDMREIKETIHPLNCVSLATYTFHVIHVNYYYFLGSVLIPCEVAIAEFSIMDGVRKVFHTLINPGELPLGVAFDAECHSANSHQIPLPPSELICESNYTKIQEDIKKFMMIKNFMPPLYTHSEDNFAAVKTFLQNLYESNCDFQQEDEFRVYPLPNLFYELKNACTGGKNLENFSFDYAKNELEKDIFLYTKGISCTFHEQTEAIEHCSLSRVQRWSYTVVGSCCRDLGIEILPKKHFPEHTHISHLKENKNGEQIDDQTNCEVQHNINNLQFSTCSYSEREEYKEKDNLLVWNMSSVGKNLEVEKDMLHSLDEVSGNEESSRMKSAYKSPSLKEPEMNTSLSRENMMKSLNNSIEEEKLCSVRKELFVNENSASRLSINSDENDKKKSLRLPKSQPEALVLLKLDETHLDQSMEDK